ncbi:uncharacterized protein LOC135501574 isoform X2 [Lineus longissimus]
MVTNQLGVLLLSCGFLMFAAVEGYGPCPKTEPGRNLARGAKNLLHTPEELFNGKLVEGKKFEELDKLCNSTDSIEDGMSRVENAVKYCIYKDRLKVLDSFDITGLNETFLYMCDMERRNALQSLTECLNSKENTDSMAKCRKQYYDDRVKNATTPKTEVQNKCTWFRAIVYCAETAAMNPKCEKDALDLYKEMSKLQLPACDCNANVRHPDDMKAWSGSYKCKATRCVSFMGKEVNEATVQSNLLFGADHMDQIEWMCKLIPGKSSHIAHELTKCIVKPDCFYLTKLNKFKLINVDGMIKAAERICNTSELIKNDTENFMDSLNAFTICQGKMHAIVEDEYRVKKDMKDTVCRKHAANTDCLRESFNTTSRAIYNALEDSLKMRLPDICDCKPLGIDPRAVVGGAERFYLSSILAILIPFAVHRIIL